MASLFGGAFSDSCHIGKISVTLLERAMVSPKGVAVEIDPTDRKLRRIGLSEVFRNIRYMQSGVADRKKRSTISVSSARRTHWRYQVDQRSAAGRQREPSQEADAHVMA